MGDWLDDPVKLILTIVGAGFAGILLKLDELKAAIKAEG